jgi:hypothetical protein
MEDSMKKLVICCALGLCLAVSGVFANHPGGWGLGIMGQGGWGRGDAGTMGGGALSLKAPKLPVYWGLNLKIGSKYFSAGATGDVYVLDGLFVPIKGDDGFGYFIGLGGYLGFSTRDGNSNALGFGARVPLGVNVVVPVSKIKLEAFLDVAPGLGLDIFFWDKDYEKTHGSQNAVDLGFNIAGEIGVRIWF